MLHSTERHLIYYAALLGVTLLLASLFIHLRERTVISALTHDIETQQTLLEHIAGVIDQGGADPVVDALVTDCNSTDRERFDGLLSSLATLSRTELLEVDRLFGMCGDYYAQRKAIMVARFKREYEVYITYLALADILDKRTVRTAYPDTEYAELVALEETRSLLLQELVAIQAAIISDLKEGASPQSEKIAAHISNAKGVNDKLGSTGIEIDELQARLSSL